MSKVKKLNFASKFAVEGLEGRQYMAVWGPWPKFLGMDTVFANYPWLNGGGNGVAVIDKGIDYWHPALGGNRATNTKSPRVVNVKDYLDGDNDPFPSTSEDVDPTTAHATGVAGILAAQPFDYKGLHYQGILQNSLLYNLRTDRNNSQSTIQQALQWVVDHHTQYHITAINLTDFVGTNSATPVYATQIQALWNAGVFVATPVANDWQGDNTKTPAVPPHQAIGLPASSPYIFGTGGVVGTFSGSTITSDAIRPQTQRGNHLDLLGPAERVTLPYYTAKTDSDVYVDYGSGNSWGTPHTVGTAVLIQQIDPTITPAEIMQILQDSGETIADPDAAISGHASYKRLDMYAAVNLAYSRRDDALDQGAGGNDDMAHASLISLNGSNHGSLTNLKSLIHDHDFYAFNVNGPTDLTLSIDYNGPSAFPTGQVLDADGNVVGTIDDNGLSKRFTAGTYYIDVFDATKSLSGTYGVNVDPQGSIVVGSVGQNGTFNSMKYDSSDNLNFVWYDSSTHSLKYAKRNPSKVWSTVSIVDSGGDVGNFVSMDLDSTGKPGVAYYDATNADLKYAHFNGTSWDVETVESNFTTGYYPSLKFGAGDKPAIAYYYKTSGDLKFATKSGGSWTISTLDSKGDVGRYPSLAMNPGTGRWAIAYEKTSTGAFRYIQQNKTGWAVTDVDTPGLGGGFASLAFDQNNLPAFSYYDAKNADLKFARFNGTNWAKTVLASKKSQGLYTNLFFDSGDNFNPVVYYFNKTGNTLNDARFNGSSWEYETLATGGGRHNSVSLNSSDFETFAWLDDTSGDLVVRDL